MIALKTNTTKKLSLPKKVMMNGKEIKNNKAYIDLPSILLKK